MTDLVRSFGRISKFCLAQGPRAGYCSCCLSCVVVSWHAVRSHSGGAAFPSASPPRTKTFKIPRTVVAADLMQDLPS